MKIYLDTCSLQRPFDSKNQVRIILEAEAVLGILSYIESNKIELVNSDILKYEVENIPNSIRRNNSTSILELAKSYIKVNAKIQKRAEVLVSFGIMSLDALHLASAEYSEADYFCTCDDKLVNKARKIDLTIKVVTPIELIGEIEK
ncbi:MAG: PIN domain-containing protein [Ignavibacteria bacterium]|nr:PIN domain-containing protein [Ignavibacteria bacterium]